MIDNVIKPNPSMLSKKLLVFPTCNKDHWSAVFVFNAGNIRLADAHRKTQVDSCVLQPSFFWYCSLKPDGTRGILTQEHGLLWLLSLAYSYSHHNALEKPSKNGMQWIEAFVSASESMLKGTELFPSVRLSKDDELPKQIDGFNCGFALIAAIAIIMRDVIGGVEDSCSLTFDNCFDHSQLPREYSEEKKEHSSW